MADVDLSQLVVDRSQSSSIGLRTRRHLWTRYVLPGLLVAGFLSLVTWAVWDRIFPPSPVQVVPVLAMQAQVRAEGSALFNAAGWIEPRPTAIRVAALASGVVEELLVVEDQQVTKGQPVAQLINDDAKLTLQRAVANRQLAEARLEKVKATMVAATTRFQQPVHLEAMAAQADADLAKINTMLINLPFETRRAKSEMTFAERDYQRNVNAATSVSKREVDETKTKLETTRARLSELQSRETSLRSEANATENRRDAIKLQLKLLADEIQAKDEALAEVKAAEASLKLTKVAESEAELLLSRMKIVSPVDGRVYQLVGLPGARVGEGVMTAMAGHDGSTVITMYQPEKLQIRVDVRFEDIPKVSLGQPVRIDNPALKTPIIGYVLFISSEADIQKNTLQVKVAIDTPPNFFKPEMLVDVTFLSPKQLNDQPKSDVEMRLFVPKDKIEQSPDGAFVWLADQSAGLARKVNIEAGNEVNGGLVEVLSGLDLGSRLVAGDTSQLTDGQRIRVVGEDRSQ